MAKTSNIEIYDSHGITKAVVAVNTGAKGKFSIGGEDYITLPFNVSVPIAFAIGDWCDLTAFYDEGDGMGGKFAKRYEIVDLPSPTYNESTGGYHYDLRMDAYYYAWKHKIFKFIPESGAQETSWNLTAALNVHLNVIKKNLQELGYNFNGEDYEWSIEIPQDQQTGKPLTVFEPDKAKSLSYNNTNIIDALNMMAQEWECEWWVTDKTIHFGKLEHSDEIELKLGEQVSNMTRSDSDGTFATRLYVFGADRNLPTNYRPVTSDVTVNGIVQKRLMLPDGTPYIDAYKYLDGQKVWIGEEGYDSPNATEMPREEAVEGVIATDDIYPRTKSHVTSVNSYRDEIKDEEDNPTGEYEYFYYVTTNDFQFDEEYILPGSELQIKFISGKLNGMIFGCTFRKANTYIGTTKLTQDVFEIVANEDYGRKLPAEPLIPTAQGTNAYGTPYEGDQFVILGWDSTKMGSTGLVENAETELYNYGVEYIKRTMIDDSTYTATLMSHWVFSDRMHRTYSAGQRVKLINPSFFEGERHSRIIGYELNLDIPYDAPQYTIGESVEYSRITDIESKVDEITYGGVSFQGSGGSSVYLIKNNDSTAPSEHNAFSASRANLQFYRKDIDDSSEHGLTLRYLHVKSSDSTPSAGTDITEEDLEIIEDSPTPMMSRLLAESAEGDSTDTPTVDIDPSDITWGQLQNIDPTVDSMARGKYGVEMMRGGKYSLFPMEAFLNGLYGNDIKIRRMTLDEYDALPVKETAVYLIMTGDTLHYVYIGETLFARSGGSSGGGQSNGFPYTFPISF